MPSENPASTHSGVRKGRPAKRDAVVEAAMRTFLANGYAGTTLEMIASEAAVSTATLFKHFRTKADAFGSIMSQVFGDESSFDWPTLPKNNPSRALSIIGQAYADTLVDDNVRRLFRVIIAEVPRFPEMGQQLYERGKAPYLSHIEAFLREQHRLGQLRIPDATLATRQFLGMINDVLFWPHMLVMDIVQTDAEIRKVVRGAVRTFCRAYAPE